VHRRDPVHDKKATTAYWRPAAMRTSRWNLVMAEHGRSRVRSLARIDDSAGGVDDTTERQASDDAELGDELGCRSSRGGQQASPASDADRMHASDRVGRASRAELSCRALLTGGWALRRQTTAAS